LQRPPPSFTINTVEEFRLRSPGDELFLLIGSDHVPKLEMWHRSAELRQLARFVVLHRGTATVRCDFPVIARQIDISATDIRNRVASGRSIRYLVPRAVEEIIRRRALYQEPPR